MRDRVKTYMCESWGIVCSVEREYVEDGYGGEELVVRCNCCGRILE